MRLPWNRWETDFWLLNLPNSVTRLGTFYYSVASVFGEKVAQNWARYWANFEMEVLFANWAAMFSIWKISCLKYLVTLLPNDAWSHCFPMKLHSQAEQDAILKMTNEKNKSIFKKYFLMRQPRPLFVCFCLFKQHKWLLLIPLVRTSNPVMNTT